MDNIEMQPFEDRFSPIERQVQDDDDETFFNRYDDDTQEDELEDDELGEQWNEVIAKMAKANRNDKPLFRKWEAEKKRKIARFRKNVFKTKLGQVVNMKDGPKSAELIRKSIIEKNDKTTEVTGIEYKGKKVFVYSEGGGLRVSENKANKKVIGEFIKLMKAARAEHEKTANGTIEEIVGGPVGVNDIRVNVIDRINSEVEINMVGLDDEMLREVGGILATKRIENLGALDTAVKYWEEKAQNETDARKRVEFQNLSDIAKLKADEMRLRNNLKPAYKETLDLIETDDITRFQKFKKFAKDNLGATAAISISIAGIITTVVLAGKKGIIAGAKVTGALANSVGRLGKAALPILVPLVNILVTALTWGAKGMSWLAKNLWVLAIALGYILYRKVSEKMKS